MNFTYEAISNKPILFRRLTGLTLSEFDILLDKFKSQLVIHYPTWRKAIDPSKRIKSGRSGKQTPVRSPEGKLFYILFYTRIYPLLTIQGLFFGHGEPTACEWVGKLLPVLDASLGSAHVKPKRARGRSLEEIIAEFPELVELGVLSDGVERPIRRPKDKDKQKKNYSGKKKRHTTKRVTITHPLNQYILAVSNEHPATDHDKKIADEMEVDCRSPIPVGVDSGFVGLEWGQANVLLPIKRKPTKKGQPKTELTPEQKSYNKALASPRVTIEHSNAGFKRNRSASDVLRNTREGMGDMLTVVAMSLHNLRVMNRASYQTG